MSERSAWNGEESKAAITSRRLLRNASHCWTACIHPSEARLSAAGPRKTKSTDSDCSWINAMAAGGSRKMPCFYGRSREYASAELASMLMGLML